MLLTCEFAGTSPKLLTPSEFKSPVKAEPELEKGMIQPALLSPASIVASTTTNPIQTSNSYDQAISTSNSQSSGHPPSVPDNDTLTSVTLSLEESHPPPLDATNDSVHVHEEHEVEPVEAADSVDKGGRGMDNEVEVMENGAVAGGRIDAPVPQETEEDTAPSAEDTQKTFDSIMEFLNVDPPEATISEQPADNPDLRKPEGVPEESSADATTPQENEPKKLANSSFTASFPDVVKPATYQESVLNVDEDKDVVESKWPDIGAPEPSIEYVQPADVRVNSAVSNSEVYIEESELPGVGLLMPSALADVQDLTVTGSGVEMEAANSTPDLLEQEVSIEVKGPLDSEDGTLKVKSKPRKKTKRGKKQNAEKSSCVGVVEVVDAPRYIIQNIMSLHDSFL